MTTHLSTAPRIHGDGSQLTLHLLQSYVAQRNLLPRKINAHPDNVKSKKKKRNKYFKNTLVQKNKLNPSSFKLKVFKDYFLRKEMYHFGKIPEW